MKRQSCISEYIRNISSKYTKSAMLSRGLAGIIDDKALVIKLPGSRKASGQMGHQRILEYYIACCVSKYHGSATHSDAFTHIPHTSSK